MSVQASRSTPPEVSWPANFWNGRTRAAMGEFLGGIYGASITFTPSSQMASGEMPCREVSSLLRFGKPLPNQIPQPEEFVVSRRLGEIGVAAVRHRRLAIL